MPATGRWFRCFLRPPAAQADGASDAAERNAVLSRAPLLGAALAYLPRMVAIPPIAVWCFQLDGVCIGATRTAEMRNGMLISLAADLLALWLFVPAWGNHGLWLSLTVFFAARSLTLGLWLPRIGRSIAAAPG